MTTTTSDRTAEFLTDEKAEDLDAELGHALAAIGHLAEQVRPFLDPPDADGRLPRFDDLGRLYVMAARARTDVEGMRGMLDEIDEAMDLASKSMAWRS